MSARKVLDAEAAYLLLVARRVLNFQRKAEERGEEYHDLTAPTDLQCGFSAKLKFIKSEAGQYHPEVILGPASVHPIVDSSQESATAVAAEILGGPAYMRRAFVPDGSPHTHRCFCLEKDK